MTNENIAEGSNSYDKVKAFNHLGYLLTSQNSIHEEIKFIYNAGNSYYYCPNTLKFKTYKTIILPAVLYDCKT